MARERSAWEVMKDGTEEAAGGFYGTYTAGI